ncbi:MAG: sigma-70 family RNA polymerase sigma factor [Myxococcota bacterium]
MSAETAAHTRALEQELPWLRTLARRLATDDADDLVQETWIRAQGARPRHGGLRPWLGTILRNNHRMARRSAQARQRREQAQTSPDAPSPEAMVAAQQLHALLGELLEELDEDDRHIIRQRYVDERSAVEIADELGVPAATIRTRLRRALQRLRSRLDERYGERGAWAVAATGTTLPQLGAVVAMKAVLGVSLVAVVAAGVLWWADGDVSSPPEDGQPQVPSTTETSSVVPSKPATTPTSKAWTTDASWEERRGKRDAMRLKIRDALALDQPDEVQPKRYELPSIDMSVDVGKAVASCAELLEVEHQGRISLSFHYLGAPGVGVIVDEVTVDADELNHPDFTECLVESATLAELDPADQPLEGTFRAHYTAGRKPNNLLLFVQANPKLGEQYEAFAQLLERGPQGVDDALASGLAETIDANPDLARQFEQWIIDDGLELSVFQPE